MERRDGKPLNHPVADEVQRAEFINEIWARRRKHETFPQIAEALDMSVATAHKYYKLGLKMQAPPGAEIERIMAIQQLEESLAIAWKLLEASINDVDKSVKVLNVISKLMKDKRDLMGLDADKKFQVKHTVESQLDSELGELMDQFEVDQEQRDLIRRKRFEEEQGRRGFRLS